MRGVPSGIRVHVRDAAFTFVCASGAFAGRAVLGALPEDAAPGRALLVTLLPVAVVLRGFFERRIALRRRLPCGKRGPPAAAPRSSRNVVAAVRGVRD